MFKITKIHVSSIIFVISFLLLVFIFIVIISLPPFTIDTSNMATPVTEAGFQFIHPLSFNAKFIPAFATFKDIWIYFFLGSFLCVIYLIYTEIK